MTTEPKQRFDDLPPSTQAGILCNDPRFQTFAAKRCGYPGGQFTQGAAAEYVRQVCLVSSRCDLLHDQAAAERFQALRTEFDAWTGKLATPRP
ncbi:hypothetical protein K3725_09880 [Leisingera sp. S132]|uniref:hypothetical protein n=1 Tax=Leisingera sp. S132 TaxID=2867016 RepID=UPI0021A742D3|nr:hypothetical protein [Leisingera sp. S132]UWQ77632.1 hypothetical protein K3725_09880 [Leisingera sp. S132]